MERFRDPAWPETLAILGAVVAVLLVALALPLDPVHAESLTSASSQDFEVIDWSKSTGTTPVKKTIDAELRRVGTRAAVYVETGSASVPDAVVEQLLQVVDLIVYPSVVGALGNDPRADDPTRPLPVILVYDFGSPRVQGYFDPADLQSGAPREIIYLDRGTLVMSSLDRSTATVAHEFAHLIVHYRGYLLDPDPGRALQTAWLQEGLATYAELASGFGSQAQDRLDAFLMEPALTALTWWPRAGGYLQNYGASYAFATYLRDQAGAGALKSLAEEKKDGVAAVDAALQRAGSGEDFTSLFDDWVLANFLDGRLPARQPYTYDSLQVAASPEELTSPIPVVGRRDVLPYSALYLDLPATARDASARAVVDGDDNAPLRAALVSWDSDGVLTPSIEPFVLDPVTAGGTVEGPAGYDRHTLAVWAHGPEGTEMSFRLQFSLGEAGLAGTQFLDVGGADTFYPYISTLSACGIVSGEEIPAGSGLWYYHADRLVSRAQYAKIIVGAAGLHTPEIESAQPRFSDVPFAGVVYPFDYVQEAAAAGITNGLTSTTFGPNENITRGQLVKMLIRAADAIGRPLEKYVGNERVFVDVPPGNPDYVPIMTARQAGIIDGRQPDSLGRRFFDPAGQANRGQVAKMTANLLPHLQ